MKYLPITLCAILSLFYLGSAQAQIVFRSHQHQNKRIDIKTSKMAESRNAPVMMVDSILTETFEDGEWYYDLYQVNYYDQDCKVVKDSLASDTWHEGVFTPDLIEFYDYDAGGLLTQELLLSFQGTEPDSAIRALHTNENQRRVRSRFDIYSQGWDSTQFGEYVYYPNGLLHKYIGTSFDPGSIHFISEYFYDTLDRQFEEITSISPNVNGPFTILDREQHIYTQASSYLPTELRFSVYEDSAWLETQRWVLSFDTQGLPIGYNSVIFDDGKEVPFARANIFARFGCASSGTSSNLKPNAVMLFLNPYDGGPIQVSGAPSENLEITVFNTLGGLVCHQNFTNGMRLDLPHQGFYFLVIRSEGQIVAQKKMIIAE